MCAFTSESSSSSVPVGSRARIQTHRTLSDMVGEYERTVHGSVGVGVIKGFFAASFRDYESDLFIEAIDGGDAAIFTAVVKFGSRSFESSFEYRGCSIDELVGTVLPAQVALIREQMRVASEAALHGADDEVVASDVSSVLMESSGSTSFVECRFVEGK